MSLAPVTSNLNPSILKLMRPAELVTSSTFQRSPKTCLSHATSTYRIVYIYIYYIYTYIYLLNSEHSIKQPGCKGLEPKESVQNESLEPEHVPFEKETLIHTICFHMRFPSFSRMYVPSDLRSIPSLGPPYQHRILVHFRDFLRSAWVTFQGVDAGGCCMASKVILNIVAEFLLTKKSQVNLSGILFGYVWGNKMPLGVSTHALKSRVCSFHQHDKKRIRSSWTCRETSRGKKKQMVSHSFRCFTQLLQFPVASG